MVERTRYKEIRGGEYGWLLLISNGRQGNLERALRALVKMNIYIGVLEETKILDDTYMKKSCGYNVITARAESVFQVGIALVYRSSPFWTI
jgi:hypothetical protein